jgi:hypothetical protein
MRAAQDTAEGSSKQCLLSSKTLATSPYYCLLLTQYGNEDRTRHTRAPKIPGALEDSYLRRRQNQPVLHPCSRDYLGALAVEGRQLDRSASHDVCHDVEAREDAEGGPRCNFGDARLHDKHAHAAAKYLHEHLLS